MPLIDGHEYERITDDAGGVTIIAYGAPRGLPGQSAYEIAVQKGFIGTVDEWLALVDNTGLRQRVAALEAIPRPTALRVENGILYLDMSDGSALHVELPAGSGVPNTPTISLIGASTLIYANTLITEAP